MRIDKIELSDVYGHRRAVVDLTNIGAVVVVGPNGAGKSSLFVDGVLFALYGRSAVRGELMSNVVRDGATEAVATVWFNIDGASYMVQRTYSQRSKRGSSTVNLVSFDGNGLVKENVGGKVAEVDSKIVELIGSDYKAFTLGAIMRQGESSFFTKLTPTERIKALSQIVGVEHLRNAFERAGSRQHELKKTIDQLRTERSRVEDIQDGLSGFRESLEDVEGKLKTHKEKKKFCEDQVHSFGEAKKASEAQLESVNKEYDRMSGVMARLNALSRERLSLSEAKSEAKNSQQRLLLEGEHIKGSLPEGCDGVDTRDTRAYLARLVDAVDEVSELAESAKAYQKSNDDYRSLIQVSSSATSIYDKQLKAKAEIINKLVVEIDSAEFDLEEDRHGNCVPTVSDIDKLEEFLDAEKGAVLLRHKKDSSLREKSNLAFKEFQDFQERRVEHVRVLKAREDALTNERPSACTMNHCGLIREGIEARRKLLEFAKDTTIASMQAEVDDLRLKVDKLEPLSNHEAVLMSVESNLTKLSTLRTITAEYHEQARALDSMKNERQLLEEQLTNVTEEFEGILLSINEVLVSVEVDTSPNGADEFFSLFGVWFERLKSKRDEVEALLKACIHRDEWSPKAKRKFDEAHKFDAKLNNLEERLSFIEKEIESLRDESSGVESLRQQRDELKKDVDSWTTSQNEALELVEGFKDEISSFRESAATLRGRIGSLEERLEKIGDVDDKLEAAKLEANELQYSREFLKVAPSLVVGSAIPRIEQVANDILSDIAPGTTIRIERQRQTLSGEVRDEVTVVVVSGGAVRDIETFSGGERFRIDVALRLALARASAGRTTGRSIETLVVDEGWGSLDAEGINSLKETFARLADRFTRIIVVTHVPDVADMFSRIIEVSPSIEGDTQINLV